MTRYVALLRGINVGGKNVIKMSALKAGFEDAGFEDVITYIQSGNVIFTAKTSRNATLTKQVEALLTKRHAYEASVVVRSQQQLQAIVDGAPRGFGTQPDTYRYDVIFLKDSLTPAAAFKNVPTNPDVDKAHAGKDALYFSRLIAKATQSRLSRIASMPMYQHMTIRNWNTTTKLLTLMEGK